MKQSKNNITNQVHPPLPKKERVDGRGNDHSRLWLKDGNTTMLITKELTNSGCKALINSINSTLIRLGAKALPKERYLITK